MLQFAVMLVCPITFEPLKMGISCIEMSLIPKEGKGTLSMWVLTACKKVAATRLAVSMLHASSCRATSTVLGSEKQEAPS